MDKGLEQEIANNINSLIYQRISKGVMELDSKKIINFIRNRYRIEPDYQALNDILSKNPNVDSVSDNKIILKKDPTDSEVDDTNEIDKEVHDMAADQAQKNLQSESFDIINRLKEDTIIPARSIQLDEDNLYYPLHKGARKQNANYIVNDIKPQKDLAQTVVECKISNSKLTIELPLECFKNI